MKGNLILGCLGVLFILTMLVGGATADDKAKINLNLATVEDLSRIPGLNEDLAQKIVKLRNENGEFIDMEELLDVPGIDNELLQKLKKYLFIEPVDDCNC
jgi:competence ComEA-like helix-hairpin-helix protein